MATVLVLGAGVIGLTTAITLQQAGYTVDVWARDLPPYTTSNKVKCRAGHTPPFHAHGPALTCASTRVFTAWLVTQAAAYWFPFHVYPAHRVEKWAARTLAYYREHLLPDPRAGVIPATYLHVSMQEKDEKPEGLVRVDTG